MAFDANLVKIFARYFFGTRFYTLSENIRRDLERQIGKEGISGRVINNALMDFAASMTTFEKIDKTFYPIQDCQWFLSEGTLEKKVKTSRKTSKK